MNIKSINSNKNLSILIGIVLLLLILFNVISGLIFGYMVFDITSDNRYNLSPTTKKYLQENKSNITIRLYVSKNLNQSNQSYGDYADYINRMLSKYADESNGKIKLDVVEVTPYSSREIEARKLNIRPLETKLENNNLYLGAHFIAENKRVLNIPNFMIERKSILEDDITRLLSILTSDYQPLIGVISPSFNIASQGRIVSFNDDWPFIMQLKVAGFRILPIDSKSASIPENVDALLVYYPLNMFNINLYAIDQYLVRGGNVMIMLDAFSETRFQGLDTFDYYNSGMDNFLREKGIFYLSNRIVGDMQYHQIIDIEGKQTAYPLYINVVKDNMAIHPIMEGINQLRLNYSSFFYLDEDELDLQAKTLFLTSNKTGILSAEKPTQSSYSQLKHLLKEEAKSYPLSILLEGKFFPFFKTPIISNEEFLAKLPLFHAIAEKEGKLLLVGDSDMVNWSLWRNQSKQPNQPFYISDNLFFIRNSMDYLTGSKYITVGQKFLVHSQNNVKQILYEKANEYYETNKKELSDKLHKIKQELSEAETQNNMFDSSMGQQTRIFNLQQNETNIEEEINQINYKIQKFYNRLLIGFALMLVFIPSLLFIIIIKAIYYYYQNIYLLNKRNTIYE